MEALSSGRHERPFTPDMELARAIAAMSSEERIKLAEALEAPFEPVRSNRAPVVETGKDETTDPE